MDGKRWLEGDEAVAIILSLPGDSPDLIPADLPMPTPGPWLVSPVKGVWTHRITPSMAIWTLGAGRDGARGRIAAYLAKLPNLGAGQGRDDVAYRLAAFLVRDLRLSDAEALPWLLRWDGSNRPPKGESRLREILANARLYGRHGYGAGLTPPPTQPSRPDHHLTMVRCSFTVEVSP